MITKKHLKELADIVYDLSKKGEQDGANAVEGFARRHAPNFSQSHWDSYMYTKDEKILKKVGWLK